jgi:hypothetical protein
LLTMRASASGPDARRLSSRCTCAPDQATPHRDICCTCAPNQAPLHPAKGRDRSGCHRR